MNIMGVIPRGKTEGLSSAKTGAGASHSEARQGAGQSFQKTGFSATAAAMGRGKISRK